MPLSAFSTLPTTPTSELSCLPVTLARVKPSAFSTLSGSSGAGQSSPRRQTRPLASFAIPSPPTTTSPSAKPSTRSWDCGLSPTAKSRNSPCPRKTPTCPHSDSPSSMKPQWSTRSSLASSRKPLANPPTSSSFSSATRLSSRRSRKPARRSGNGRRTKPR